MRSSPCRAALERGLGEGSVVAVQQCSCACVAFQDCVPVRASHFKILLACVSSSRRRPCGARTGSGGSSSGGGGGGGGGGGVGDIAVRKLVRSKRSKGKPQR